MLAATGALSGGTPNPAAATLTVSLDTINGGFEIAGTPVRDLYPGAVRQIEISIENPQGRRIRVQSIEGRVVSTSRRGCAPVPSNLELRPHLGQLPRTVSARSRARVGFFEVHMPNSVVDECQRAVFSIRFTGKAALVDR